MVETMITEGGVDAVVEDDSWAGALGCAPEIAVDRVAAALRSELGLTRLDAVVLFTSDAAVAALNGAYRGKPQPTNVLAFPAPEQLAYKGDVALARETIEREAVEQGKSTSDHAAHMIAHGLLHLLGYDHHNDAEAEAMEARERAILSRLGIADPYE
jgi:probable rRNA maturation factor